MALPRSLPLTLQLHGEKKFDLEKNALLKDGRNSQCMYWKFYNLDEIQEQKEQANFKVMKPSDEDDLEDSNIPAALIGLPFALKQR